MATLTVNASITDGYVYNSDTTYSVARAGSAAKTCVTNGAALYAGQILDMYFEGEAFVETYIVSQAFISYDTSELPDNAVITNVVEELYFTNSLSEAATIELRKNDYGTLGTASFVAGSSLSALQLLSSVAFTTSTPGGWVTFPSSPEFIAAINKTGVTQVMHASQAQRTGLPPSSPAETSFASADYLNGQRIPRLVIEYTVEENIPTVSLIEVTAVDVIPQLVNVGDSFVASIGVSTESTWNKLNSIANWASVKNYLWTDLHYE